MAYWTDDRDVDIRQRIADARQAEAKRKMDEEREKKEKFNRLFALACGTGLVRRVD